MGNDLQYPDADLDDRICMKHPIFKKQQYLKDCAYCTNDYVYIINEGYPIDPPQSIQYIGLFYENIAYIFRLLALFQFIVITLTEPDGFILGILNFILFMFVGRQVMKISNGIYTISKGSYNFVLIIPFALLLIYWFSLLSNYEDSLVSILAGLTIVLSIAPFSLYLNGKTRALFNLSDRMKIKFLQNYTIKSSLVGSDDKFWYFIMRFTFPILTMLYLWIATVEM